jgi:hypothetical protein
VRDELDELLYDLPIYFRMPGGPYISSRDATPEDLDRIAAVEEERGLRASSRDVWNKHFDLMDRYRRLAAFKRGERSHAEDGPLPLNDVV